MPISLTVRYLHLFLWRSMVVSKHPGALMGSICGLASKSNVTALSTFSLEQVIAYCSRCSPTISGYHLLFYVMACQSGNHPYFCRGEDGEGKGRKQGRRRKVHIQYQPLGCRWSYCTCTIRHPLQVFHVGDNRPNSSINRNHPSHMCV